MPENPDGPEITWDPEDCGWCDAIEDQCLYHRGIADGVEWFAKHLGNIAEDPELLNLLAKRTGSAVRR